MLWWKVSFFIFSTTLQLQPAFSNYYQISICIHKNCHPPNTCLRYLLRSSICGSAQTFAVLQRDYVEIEKRGKLFDVPEKVYSGHVIMFYSVQPDEIKFLLQCWSKTCNTIHRTEKPCSKTEARPWYRRCWNLFLRDAFFIHIFWNACIWHGKKHCFQHVVVIYSGGQDLSIAITLELGVF